MDFEGLPKMDEEEEVIIPIDKKKANPRMAQDSIVQTIPKPWWKMPKVKAMLKEGTLFLQIRNGTFEIVLKRDKGDLNE